MPSFYINLTDIAAILVAGALLMVPVLGLTLRLVVPPIVESIARAKAMAGDRGFGGELPYRDALTRVAELSAYERRPAVESGVGEHVARR